jgi:hypothetical protein
LVLIKEEAMKHLIFALAFIPTAAVAQYVPYNAPQPPIQPGIPYGVPLQPIAPLQPPPNPYGTGYSIVTRQEYNRDMTDSETVTSIRPNDAWGNPIKPLQEILEDAANGYD